MISNGESLVQRRRVVYSALAQHLKADRLLEALWLWEQKYALGNSLELRKFVSEIVHDGDMPDLRDKLYKTLTRATYFSADFSLLPDPYDAMQQYREKCNGTFKYISAFNERRSVPFSTIIFQCMLETLLSQAKREDSVAYQSIPTKLNAGISRMELKANQRKELTQWITRKTDALQLLYPESFMSSLINHIYILYCEVFGPVVSDRMLAKSIAAAEALEEANFFHPKRLL